MSNVLVYNVEQGTNEWLALRLGKFTSSRVGDLMTNSRTKGEIFGKTAISYIMEIATERNIADWVKENLDQWFERTSISAYALQYGTDNEAFARDEYSKRFNVEVKEVGFVTRKDIAGFGDSPDGIIPSEKGVLEIKCPKNPSIHLQYSLMRTAEDLKSVNSNYYWQCYSHLLATEADWCDFVSYDMFQKNDLHRLRIYPDEGVFNQIKERIDLANDRALDILSSLKCESVEV